MCTPKFFFEICIQFGYVPSKSFASPGGDKQRHWNHKCYCFQYFCLSEALIMEKCSKTCIALWNINKWKHNQATHTHTHITISINCMPTSFDMNCSSSIRQCLWHQVFSPSPDSVYCIVTILCKIHRKYFTFMWPCIVTCDRAS